MNCWEEVATFTVAGIPKGQPRPRVVSHKGRTHTYNPTTAKAWKEAIVLAVKPYVPESPHEGSVSITMVFNMPRPKRLQRRKDPDDPIPHAAKPDIDNLMKAVLDALTISRIWKDDAQISECFAAKRYHAKHQEPGVEIQIYVKE